MSEIDEQLKAIQLQKEQLDLERLLAKRKATNSLLRYGRTLGIVLVATSLVGATYGMYVVWQERQEVLAQKEMEAQIEAIVADTCAAEFASSEDCDNRRMRGTLDDMTNLLCHNTNDHADRCALNARQNAYRTLSVRK